MIYSKHKINTIELVFALVFLFTSLRMVSQNDCVDAIFICGNTNLSGLTSNGVGIQEISSSNACSSGENNSLWLKIKINTGGTLGFLLTPQSSSITEDLDFWIFGPNVSCNNLGTAIRCSTTNPQAINQPNNLTGMNSTETDVSEGPGADGNSFIKWMDVLDNETYYIAIDRPQGESAFSVNWTGTATFYQPPAPVTTTDIRQCSLPSLPGRANFDLTPNISLAIGTQTNVIVDFFTNYNDAVTNINAISNTTAFQNTSNPQKIYLRLSNINTSCFAISDFDLLVEPPSVTAFTYSSPVCINSANPTPFLTSGFTPGGTFSSTTGLDINSTTGTIDLTTSLEGTYVITYTLLANPAICQNAGSSTFSITINPLPTIVLATPTPTFCISSPINPILFNIGGLATGAGITSGTLPLGLSDNYSNGVYTISGTTTVSGIFNYTITTSGGCAPAATYNGTITINELPIVTLPQDGYICVDDAGLPIGRFTLATNLSVNTNSFVWSNANGILLGQSGSSYTATAPGNYAVTMTNNATGCSATATTTIATFYPPSVVTATVSSYFSDIQTIVVSVLPVDDYEYKLDNNPYQDSNEFTDLMMGTHEIWVKDKFGCGIKKILVQIVNYPNYFTPNGDSYHDTWNINELRNQLNAIINIFDRYGKLIKQIKPSGPGWDGMYNGRPLPATDYWFTVDYIELGTNQQFKAHFSLLR